MTATLVWHDPDYEEFQCAGCHCPAFRPIVAVGRPRQYCDDYCQRRTPEAREARNAASRRYRARRKLT